MAAKHKKHSGDILQRLEAGQQQLAQKIEAGQQQLAQKIDLQLQRLEIVLQQTQENGRQLRLSEHTQAVVLLDSDNDNDLFRKVSRGQSMNTQELPAEKSCCSLEELQKRAKDLKAYQCAMGWQKAMEDMFKIDPEADFLTRFASGPYWTFLCIGLIIMSTIVVGIETQINTTHAVNLALSQEQSAATQTDDISAIFSYFELAFTVWMVIEVLVNGYAQRWAFIYGIESRWNAFDVVVLTFSLTMQLLQNASTSFLRVTRIARLFRMGKILRIFRVVKFLRSVRSMMISISGSVMHLLSAMLVMCIFMFVVTLTIMQCISNDVDKMPSMSAAAVDMEEIASLYGDMLKTMMTLFRAVSGGLEWSKAASSLSGLGWHYSFIWTAYIAFMVFGLLNVLTGIFVESAMSAVNNDRDNMIQAHLEERESLVNAIAAVFMKCDTQGDGQINEEEMDQILQDPQLMAYLEAIGVDATEAMGLFQLLDDDSSGTVSVDEFVTGFLHMKGTAKAVDMVTLIYENRKLHKQIHHISHATRTLREMIANLYGCLEEHAASTRASFKKAHLCESCRAFKKRL